MLIIDISSIWRWGLTAKKHPTGMNPTRLCTVVIDAFNDTSFCENPDNMNHLPWRSRCSVIFCDCERPSFLTSYFMKFKMWFLNVSNTQISLLCWMCCGCVAQTSCGNEHALQLRFVLTYESMSWAARLGLKLSFWTTKQTNVFVKILQNTP